VEKKEKINIRRGEQEMNSMKKNTRALLSRTWPLGLALAAVFILSGKSALAASAQEIDRDVTAALQTLYANTPGAQDLGNKARGILVFPNIVKGGFLFAAQYGDGALRKEGRTVGYYRSLAGSFGFQAGFSPLVTSCFLWTTHRFNISTTVTVGSWEPGQPLSSWTKALARIFPQRRYRVVFTLSSSTRRG
jgi:lipid-binding SYLF domain-containing protein